MGCWRDINGNSVEAVDTTLMPSASLFPQTLLFQPSFDLTKKLEGLGCMSEAEEARWFSMGQVLVPVAAKINLSG